MRALSDTAWAAVGVAGASGGRKVVESLRPAVTGDDVGAPADQAGLRELPRAYALSAGAIVASPALTSGLPRWCGPLGVAVQVAGVVLRVWAMRTLSGHYAHALLRRELPGYDAYAASTPRLIPALRGRRP